MSEKDKLKGIFEKMVQPKKGRGGLGGAADNLIRQAQQNVASDAPYRQLLAEQKAQDQEAKERNIEQATQQLIETLVEDYRLTPYEHRQEVIRGAIAFTIDTMGGEAAKFKDSILAKEESIVADAEEKIDVKVFQEVVRAVRDEGVAHFLHTGDAEVASVELKEPVVTWCREWLAGKGAADYQDLLSPQRWESAQRSILPAGEGGAGAYQIINIVLEQRKQAKARAEEEALQARLRKSLEQEM